MVVQRSRFEIPNLLVIEFAGDGSRYIKHHLPNDLMIDAALDGTDSLGNQPVEVGGAQPLSLNGLEIDDPSLQLRRLELDLHLFAERNQQNHRTQNSCNKS